MAFLGCRGEGWGAGPRGTCSPPAPSASSFQAANGREQFQSRGDGLAEPELLQCLRTTGLYERKMKSSKSRQQPPQTARWAPSGRRVRCPPSQGGRSLANSPSPTGPARDGETGGGRPESRSRPRAPLPTSRSPLVPQPRPAGGNARPKGAAGKVRPPGGAPPAARHGPRLSPPPAGPGAPPAPRPHLGRPPRTSPGAAASFAAAIAGAVGLAPQPRGWQHGEPGARAAPAQAASWSGDPGTRAPPGAAAAASVAPGRAAGAESPRAGDGACGLAGPRVSAPRGSAGADRRGAESRRTRPHPPPHPTPRREAKGGEAGGSRKPAWWTQALTVAFRFVVGVSRGSAWFPRVNGDRCPRRRGSRGRGLRGARRGGGPLHFSASGRRKVSLPKRGWND